jgi:ribosomal protein S18 acetylase RimI-like enzyme
VTEGRATRAPSGATATPSGATPAPSGATGPPAVDTPGVPGIEIRDVRPDEYAALGDVLVAAYDRYPETDDRYRAELRDVAARAASCRVLVAAGSDGRIVGGATYVPGPGPYAESEREGEAGIRMLAVAPDAQGRGVGRALTEACMALARASGRRRIVLLTLVSMTPAHRLYEGLGFRRAPARDWTPEPRIRLLGYEYDLD